jgi:hypothetical protein
MLVNRDYLDKESKEFKAGILTKTDTACFEKPRARTRYKAATKTRTIKGIELNFSNNFWDIPLETRLLNKDLALL